jgi:hypothetical protein
MIGWVMCVNRASIDLVPVLTNSAVKKRRPLFAGKVALLNVAPREGLEPPTNWLTANCSTD